MPQIASYCTTFLKPEMLHIYRQICGVEESSRYDSFVICKERREEQRYPFVDVEQQPSLQSNFMRRFWLKYVKQEPAIVYRGEYQVLANILQRRKVDLLHVYFGHTGVHLLPILERWQQQGGVPLVSFHGMDIQPRAEDPTYEPKLRRLLQVVPLVLARSESLCQRLRDLGCPQEKIRLNRTGIPLDKYPQVKRALPEDGKWNLVQACRFIEKKGLPTSLRAFAEFSQQYPKATFTIAGEGPMEAELKQLAVDLGIEKSVKWTGFLGEKELFELYKQSHFLLHPSQITADQNQEGVPNAMLEAMSTALPIFATFHGGIPEAVTQEKSGFLVQEQDHQGLAQALLETAANPQRWQEMGLAAAQEVREKYARENSIRALLDIYDEALAK